MSLADTANEVLNWVSTHGADTAAFSLITAFGAACGIVAYREHRARHADDEAAAARIDKIDVGVFKRENFEP